MAELCSTLLDTAWMRDLDAIKVTGSNGKGSVCAMLASILREFGVSAGLYTSPHLIEFNERIVVDGQAISGRELEDALQWFFDRRASYEALHPGDTVGAFEAFTAIALRHFSVCQPRTLVAEAGIGGRYDSTRIIPGRLAGLTAVDLEHTELLGNTLELIAYDKADLCSPGGEIVTGISDHDILRRLKAYCSLRNVVLTATIDHSVVRGVEFRRTHMEVDLEVDDLNLPGLRLALQGIHQVTNAITAIMLFQKWLAIYEPNSSGGHVEQAIRRGMYSVRWPGRFERIHENPDVFIDVGHTPAAIASVVKTVRTALAGKRILLVTGVSYDKEVEKIVTELLAIADEVICTRAHHKGSEPDRIFRIVQNVRPDIPAVVEPAIEQAVERARQQAYENDMTVLVAGGLFLSVEAKCALNGVDPKKLCFLPS